MSPRPEDMPRPEVDRSRTRCSGERGRYLQSLTVSSDAGQGHDDDDPAVVTSRPRDPARVRRILAKALLGIGVLLTGLGVAIIIACFMNDRTITDSPGYAVADVVDTSLTRTVVRFTDDDGRVYIPRNGVLYPTQLQEGQSVRVEYDSRNPEIVRVAGRDFRIALLPVGTGVAVMWAVVLPSWWWLRRSAGNIQATESATRGN